MPLSHGTTIAYGDVVMLVGKDRRTFIRTVAEGQKFECHLGLIKYEELVDVPYGSQVRTHSGHKMFILPPHTDDLIRHLQRDGQIIFPKELGYIALKLGIRPGVRVIEAGTGSGGLTTFLALLVGESGHVYSYERREDMQKRAISNLKKLGLQDRVTFHLRDISEGFEERDVEALFLDVRDPWEYLPQARAALRGGGFFGALVPTVNQIIDLTSPLYDGPWFMLEIEELILRPYKTIPERIRPDDQVVGHTGFLIFARAVDRETRVEDESETEAAPESDPAFIDETLRPDIE
ncbi:MAG: tRNA (adenine-N1)-methyltransferase [Chloroflexi bacterium]|nr:tRNA (adenine-N1)-methyltransferase [Chloroflexota bacterium]